MKSEINGQTYDEMVKELFGRFKSFQTSGKEAYKPGLDRMLLLDQLAGHPHRNYRTVHIAGTNGKGSVSNMLAAAIAAKGLKVGLYTSPHILDFRERMRTVSSDGGVRLIPEESVMEFVSTWRETMDHLDLSFFEVTTMMAFDWFAREKVDVAVIETGLGGRMDSTNIINPVLSVITNIGYDHCDILGHSLPEIAFEKAGIIKPGVPAVIGESDPDTDPVFQRKHHYTNMGSETVPPLVFADKLPLPEDFDGIHAGMDLQGNYQRKNLRTVLAAVDSLPADMVPQRAELVRALQNTASIAGFHGRWERLSVNPEVICDIGHNAHGLKWNFSRLSEMAAEGRDIIMVYGSVADKDVDAVLAIMPPCRKIFFTNADSHRAMPAAEVLDRYVSSGGSSATEICTSVAEAVEAALSFASATPGLAFPLIYVGGSTYVVAEAVPMFKKHQTL